MDVTAQVDTVASMRRLDGVALSLSGGVDSEVRMLPKVKRGVHSGSTGVSSSERHNIQNNSYNVERKIVSHHIRRW